MKNFIALFLITLQLQVFGQTTAYKTLNNIKYYPQAIYKTDSYAQERCIIDIYYPENVKQFATILWFHGGGIEQGKKEIPDALKNKGFCIIGVGYRLSPKVQVMQAIDDSAAAIAWVFNHIEEYGGDRKKIFISGHSAGGYLGMMAVLDKKYLTKYNVDANEVAGLIPFSGQCITHFTVRKERGIKETQPIIDEFAPLYHTRADAPPLLLITGDRELEMLGRYEENAYMARMMKLVGHKETRLLELGGYGHNMAYPAFPLLINEVKRLIN